jgi:hypothetical protein
MCCVERLKEKKLIEGKWGFYEACLPNMLARLVVFDDVP